jgi:hypothetical protein
VLDALSGKVVLLGDFNAHHPAWGGRHVAGEPQAEHLLLEMARRGLRLLTPEGETTWKRGRQESVIDLTFASADVQSTLHWCGPRDEWAVTQDHLPIDIRFEISLPPQPESRRFALGKLDVNGLAAYLKDTQWWQSENALTELQTALVQGLPKFCPKTRPSQYANKCWSPRAAELLAGARRARRAYHATDSDHDRLAYKTQKNLLKKELRRAGQSSWRKFLEELTECTTAKGRGLWRLARWSKQTPAKETRFIPPLRRTAREQAHSDDVTKAQILAEKFFPSVGEADLSDLEGEQQGGRVLDIPPTVTKGEIDKVLLGLLSNKTPGPDGIPNEVLTALAHVLTPHMAQAVGSCLARGALPVSYRESTTVVIRKEGKRDFSLPSSYRPIALENSLAKVIEKLVADRIAKAAEEHSLLPWNQMGARKQRSTYTALELLQTSVQTAWSARPGCIVFMLSLDLVGAFDNVSHDRLLC